MLGGHRSGGFGGKIIELYGGNPWEYPLNYFHGNTNRIDMHRVEAVAQFLNSCGNLIKLHRLLSAIAF